MKSLGSTLYQLIYIAYWKFTDHCYTLDSLVYPTLFVLCDLQNIKDPSVNLSLGFTELGGLWSRDQLCPVQLEEDPESAPECLKYLDLCLGYLSLFTVLCPLSLLKVYESILCGILWVLATIWPHIIAAVYILVHYNRAHIIANSIYSGSL